MKKMKTIPDRPHPHECADESPLMLINEISKIFAATMRESDTEIPQESARSIIINLARRDGITQLELARLTHMKPPTVSLTLKRLACEGYVSRRHDLRDNRAVRVYLTEKGKKLMRDSAKRLRGAEDVLLGGIDAADASLLITLLTKMRSNMLEDLENLREF